VTKVNYRDKAIFLNPVKRQGLKFFELNNMSKRKSTEVQGIKISYHQIEGENFINITDIARYKDADRPDVPVNIY